VWGCIFNMLPPHRLRSRGEWPRRADAQLSFARQLPLHELSTLIALDMLVAPQQVFCLL
jgi:hypothetical protein